MVAVSGFEYRRDIDGLRAVAVGAVVLFHAGFGLTGGFVGVDVFFVISGYLITSLILRRTEAGTFTLKDFWLRRVRRIAPALIVVVAAVMAVSASFMMPRDLEKVGKSAFAQAIAAANIYFSGDTGYFSGSAELKPLLHTWSLAVEEQFYLLLPLLLMAFRRQSRRTLMTALGVMAAASFGYSLYLMGVRPTSAFFLLPSRAWELLAGSLLACLPVRTIAARWQRETLAWLGLAGILVPCVLYDAETLFPGLAAVPPVLGTVLLILANTESPTSIGRVLSNRLCVGLGLISYSLYLWHWPVFALTRYWMPELSIGVAGGLVAASVGLAWVSWRYVETPFRRTLLRSNDVRLLQSVVAVQAVILLLGLSLDLLEGFPGRVSPQLAQLDAKNTWASVSDEDVAAGKLKKLGLIDEQSRPTFLLWGDSHARAMARFVDQVARHNGVPGCAAISSNVTARIVPRPDETEIIARNAAIEQLIYDQQITHIFMVQRWESTFGYHCPDDSDFHCYTSEQKQEMDRVLPNLVNRLRDHGCTVHLLCQVPRQHGDDLFRQYLFRQTVLPESNCITPKTLAEYEAEAFWLPHLQALAHLPNVNVLDIRDVCFDAGGQSIVFADGFSCYRDDDHLSDFGAERLLEPIFGPILAELGSQRPPSEGQRLPIGVAEETASTRVR